MILGRKYRSYLLCLITVEILGKEATNIAQYVGTKIRN
jgi:hypothetical protein